MRVARHMLVAALSLAAVFDISQAQLPTVTQVYATYATAVGGHAAWARVSDRADIGTANITFANLTGTYARYNSMPNKFRLVIGLGSDIGKVEQGSDGKVVWAEQPGAGVSRVEGADADYMLESAAAGDAFLDPTRFASAAVSAKESFDGVECYKVTIKMKTGRDRMDYFEVATGLKRGQVVQSANGPQTAVFRDYKTFDGKKVPTTVVQSNGQGDIIITVYEVTFTTNDPTLFVVPPGVAK